MATTKLIEEIASKKEELITAWIAQHGCQPDEAVLVTQPSADGSTRVWIEKRAEVVKSSPDRKGEPVFSGVMQYFPRAMRAVSRVSKAGNDKHNPNQPLHWAYDKSCDQPDAAARHMLTPYEIDFDTNELHLAHAAWRVLAWLEMALWAFEKGLNTPLDFKKIGVQMASSSVRKGASK